MHRSTEPLWWLLFATGGAVAALLMPVHVLIGLGLALGWSVGPLSYERALPLITHPLARLYLFGLISLSLLHWAHRFRYTLAEGLHLKASFLPISVACYGIAVAGVIASALLLFNL